MKNRIKKYTFLLIVIVSYSNSYGQVTQSDANKFVLTDVLNIKQGTKIECDVFRMIGSLKSDETIKLADNNKLKNPYDESFVYFVDDNPLANWFHNCRYVFVDKKTGKHIVLDRMTFPEKLNVIFDDFIKMKRPSSKIDVFQGKSTKTIEAVTPNNKLYAVLFCGTTAGSFFPHWKNISLVYNTLIQAYGYKKENIFVHYYTGPDHTYDNFIVDLDGGSYSIDIDYDCTKSTLIKTFKNLSGELSNLPEIPALSPDNQLFIYASGLDFSVGNNSAFHCVSDINNPSGTITFFDNELAELCEDIDCSQIIAFMDINNSNGFVLKLLDYETYDVSCKNRIVQGFDSENYIEYDITNGSYNEFLYYWSAAIRGFYPFNDFPWITNIETGDFPFSAFHYNHPGDYNPDSNNDGYVQINEAFDYADNLDSHTEEGWFKYPRKIEINKKLSNYGIEEEVFTLSGLCGNIVNPTTFSRNYLIGKQLTINERVSIFIDGNVSLSIPENCNLVLNGCDIFINDNSYIKLYGSLSLTQNKTSTISGSGYIKLNGNINSEPGATLTIQGVNQSTKLLEVNKKVIFDSDFANITLKNGKIQMNNTYAELYINSGVDNVTLDNIRVTSLSGHYSNGHEGIDIRSNGNITVKNSTFEYGYYGLYTCRASTAPIINVDDCNFKYCNYGLRAYNSGVDIDGCTYVQYFERLILQLNGSAKLHKKQYCQIPNRNKRLWYLL